MFPPLLNPFLALDQPLSKGRRRLRLETHGVPKCFYGRHDAYLVRSGLHLQRVDSFLKRHPSGHIGEAMLHSKGLRIYALSGRITLNICAPSARVANAIGRPLVWAGAVWLVWLGVVGVCGAGSCDWP